MVEDVAAERALVLARLEQLVRIETPTLDTAASAAITAVLADWWQHLGARVRVVAGDAGQSLVTEVDGAGAPLLLVGHSDTVWPVGTLAGAVPFAREGDVVRGPGVYDMKSGLIVMLAALARVRGSDHRAVRAVIVCDEEIGSPTTQSLLRDCADGVSGAIGFESPHPDGALKVGRRGSTRVRLSVTGRASHAALDPDGGISAIEELVDQLVAVRRIVREASDTGEVLYNAGTVCGGTRANVVAADAVAELGFRFIDPASQVRVLDAVHALTPVRPGAGLTVEILSSRPAWRRSAADEALLQRIAHAATGVRQTVSGRPAAGAGDTNLVGSLGAPTVDGFGPRGGGAHAVSEHILLSSLFERIALLEAVLRSPA